MVVQRVHARHVHLHPLELRRACEIARRVAGIEHVHATVIGARRVGGENDDVG
jgi:hypothetical protein